MAEPPLNVGEIYDWYVFPNGIEMKDYSSPEKDHFIVQHAWMLCNVVYTLNEVATEVKKRSCGENANFTKSWHFHDETLFQAMIDDPSNPFQNPEKAKMHGVDLSQVDKKKLG